MSTEESELLELATRIAGAARPGEQLEVCVTRHTSTTVKAFDGEVESFTSADTAGIGVRVVRDHRVGFASAGTLDEGVVAELLADARDNASFAEPDEWAGVAEPDGVEAVPIDLWRPAVPAFPATAKIDLALALERAVRAGDPRITGIRTAVYSDGWGEAAVATSTGIAVASRSTGCSLSVLALASDGATTMTGSRRRRSGGNRASSPSRRPPADAVLRATRLLGARKITTPAAAARARAPPGGDGARHRRRHAHRRARREGPVAVRRPRRRGDRLADAHAGRRPHRRPLARRRQPRRRGPRHPAQRPARRRRAPRASSSTPTPGRRLGLASTGSAVRGSRSTPAPAAQAIAVAPGAEPQDELLRRYDGALLVQSMTGLHSGVNTVSGDFSVGVEGLLVSGGELGQPVREVTVASTLQRLLLDIAAVGADLEWLPGGDAMPTIVIGEVALSGS